MTEAMNEELVAVADVLAIVDRRRDEAARVVPRSNDLERFRYSAPAWWEGFCRGRAGQREAALNEEALQDEWQKADWMRGKLERIE